MSQISDVYDFNNAARGPRTDGGLVIDWDLMRQAQLHIQEETRELFDAIDLLRQRGPQAESEEALDLYREVFDGAVDLAWVALNVLYAGGCTLPESFWEAAARANMAKIPDCDACHGRKRRLYVGGEDFCDACQGTGKGAPLMDADKKILKPAGWVKPDGEQRSLIEAMGGWNNKRSLR